MDILNSTPQPSLSHELRAIINQRNILTAKSKSEVLNALDKHIEQSRRTRQFELRNKVIEEIFSSEVSYLYQLEVIIKFFKDPLETFNLVAVSERRALFGNIESIYQVNGELVNQLKIQGNNVGAAFLYLAPFFKLYSMYAYDYKNALTLLENLVKENAKLRTWIKNQESRPEVGNRLSALLIAPIQRIPRYRLLLRQLLSLTPAAHPHCSVLVDALKEIERVTAHLDGIVHDQQKNSRLVVLQKCLMNSKPTIVAPDKRLLKEGELMKMSSNGQKAQRRYFILLNDSLLYCKLVGRAGRDKGKWHTGELSEPHCLQCCCVLPLGKCHVESVLGPGVFSLTCRSDTLILFSEHRDEGLEWVTAIRSAISQYEESIKTLRKKSSSRYPLHLNRKRKRFQDKNETQEDESPAKKIKTSETNLQENLPPTGYMQSIKSLFRTFGETVRQYLYPGPIAR